MREPRTYALWNSKLLNFNSLLHLFNDRNVKLSEFWVLLWKFVYHIRFFSNKCKLTILQHCSGFLWRKTHILQYCVVSAEYGKIRCEVTKGRIQNKILFLPNLVHSRPVHLYLIFEKSSLKNRVRWTGLLTCKNQFQNWFLQATQAVKIQFEID